MRGDSTMKKIVAMVIMLGLLATGAMAAAKVAIVDTQTVFDKTKLGKKYQGIIKEYYESRKKILDLDMDELQKLQDNFIKQKQGKTLNDKAQQEIEDSINKKYNDFKKKQNEFSGEIGKKQEELFKSFNQDLMAAVKDLAKKDKIEMVINKIIDVAPQAGVPATPVVLYSDEGLDITDKVIIEMDKREDAKK
jgi:Skp family chaperone for outer membrane proteins